MFEQADKIVEIVRDCFKQCRPVPSVSVIAANTGFSIKAVEGAFEVLVFDNRVQKCTSRGYIPRLVTPRLVRV